MDDQQRRRVALLLLKRKYLLIKMKKRLLPARRYWVHPINKKRDRLEVYANLWRNWGGWRFKEAYQIPQDVTWKLWLYPGGYKTSDHKARYQYEESHWARAQARCYSPPFSWRSITCINSLTLQIWQVHSLTDYRWNLCGTMDCSAADIHLYLKPPSGPGEWRAIADGCVMTVFLRVIWMLFYYISIASIIDIIHWIRWCFMGPFIFTFWFSSQQIIVKLWISKIHVWSIWYNTWYISLSFSSLLSFALNRFMLQSILARESFNHLPCFRVP